MSESLIQTALRETFDHLSNTLAAKNADYSGASEFHNFDFAESLTGVSAERGILIRMCDKMARLGNLLAGAEAQVKDEKIEDTIDDLIGYSVILKARRAARQAPDPTARPTLCPHCCGHLEGEGECGKMG